MVLVEQEAKSWYLGRRGTWRIIMVLGKILGEKLEGPGTVFGVSSLLIQNNARQKASGGSSKAGRCASSDKKWARAQSDNDDEQGRGAVAGRRRVSDG